MLNILLAGYLLVVAPAISLWRSRHQRGNKPEASLASRYWSMSWKVLVLLTLLWLGAREAGYTATQLGFDMPVSRAGTWGLVFAPLLLGGIALASVISERRQTPEGRIELERKALASPFPWPRTRMEVLGFAVSITLMSAAWEILYRGFLLLLLTPHIGLPMAIVASALAYGLAHGYENPQQLLGSIVAAFIFTLAYALTHSLWWLIAIHAGLPLSALPAAMRALRRRAARQSDAMRQEA
ncbi:CPBP family intramembrane glutamic endopeptidase [Pseudoduganella armeniaca]|nr:CPBP family intramembrane glutamic endopeptidase [Pseudoduganella armeniaca]